MTKLQLSDSNKTDFRFDNPDYIYINCFFYGFFIKKEQLEGIIATNTTTKRRNLQTSEVELKKIGNGGLSGSPLAKNSTEIIRYISKQTQKSIPIIGVGGIMNPKDALDKIQAGADLIQLYTGFIYSGPSIVKKINNYLSKKQ